MPSSDEATETPLLYFDDVAVGDVWDSPARTVTEADVLAFAELTGDHNPLHTDAQFAAQTPFGRPIMHGLLGLSLVAGLASLHPRMATLSFLRILEWSFLAPVFFGDTVHVRSEVLQMEPKGRGRRGIIVWGKELINSDGAIVQRGQTETLVQARPS